MNYSLRAAVLAVHGGLCRYCRDADASEVDHITSVHEGGSDAPENLTAACRRCNAAKAGTPLDAATMARVRVEAASLAGDVTDVLSSPESRRAVVPFVRVAMALPKPLAEALDRWRKRQPGFPSRAEAVREAVRLLTEHDAGTGPVRAKEGEGDV